MRDSAPHFPPFVQGSTAHPAIRRSTATDEDVGMQHDDGDDGFDNRFFPSSDVEDCASECMESEDDDNTGEEGHTFLDFQSASGYKRANGRAQVAMSGSQPFNVPQEVSTSAAPLPPRKRFRKGSITGRELLKTLPKPGQPRGLERWIGHALEGSSLDHTDCVICKLTTVKPKCSHVVMRRHMETPHRAELALLFETAFHYPNRARLDPRAFEHVVLYFMFAAPWLRDTYPNDKQLETELSAFLEKYDSFMPAPPNRKSDFAYPRYKSSRAGEALGRG